MRGVTLVWRGVAPPRRVAGVAPPRRVAACLGVVEASGKRVAEVGVSYSGRERWEDYAGGSWVGPALVSR